MTRPVERGSRVVDVDALKRRHEPVRIALTALLAVCDDVQACTLLVADGEQRGVVLRLVEKFRSDMPQFPGAHPRRKTLGKPLAVD
jgi:hypothetical protein